MGDFAAQLAQFLRDIYQQVRGIVREEITAVLGNVLKGGKIVGTAIPVDGTTITVNGSGQITASGAGTVTSVTVTTPTSVLTVSPATITGSGTFAFALATQVANTVWAGPTTGIAAGPTFRGLVPADIPSLDAAKIVTGTFAAARLPIATMGAFGAVKPDGSTITISSGVISAEDSGFANPMAHRGALIRGGTGGAAQELQLGVPGQVPSPVGSDAEWLTPSDRGGSALPDLAGGKILYGKAASVASLHVLFVGDSITLGVTGGGSTTPPDAAASWMSANGNGSTIVANNQGISGTTSDDWLPTSGTGDLLAAVAAAPPGTHPVVHVMLGSNDSNDLHRTTAAAFGANLLAICAYLLAAGYRMIYLSYPPYSVPGGYPDMDATSNVLQVAYQRAVDALCNGQTIRQGDTSGYAFFLDNQAELADGLHPGPAGKVDLGQLWGRAMRAGVGALTGQQIYGAIAAPVADGTFLGRAGGAIGYYAPPTGVDVTTKGDLQGYTTSPARVPVSGHDGRVLTEDSSQATGLSWEPLPALPTTLASLTDVYLHNLQDGDTLGYSAVLAAWVNSSAGFGWDLIDDLTGNAVVDDASGFQVISDPLPTLVVDGLTGDTLVDDLSGANIVNS